MSIRAEKVSELIKRIVAKPINELSSELSAGLTTVTSVKVSNDLQVAKIYISVLGGKISPADFINAAEKRKGEIRHYLAMNVKLRYTPELRFFLDDTLDQIEYIQKLLDSAKK